MRLEDMRKIADSRTGSGGGYDFDCWRCYQAFTDMCEMKIDKLLAVAEAAKELFVEDYLFVVERQFGKSYLKAKITPLFKAIEELERE